MPRPEGIKSLPIPREIHKEVKRESVDLDVSMGEVLRLMWDAYANRDSQQLPAISPQTIQESDMISVAELNKGDRQLVVNLIAMLRDGKSPVLPLLREGLKDYMPEARNEDVGRKDRRHRREKI